MSLIYRLFLSISLNSNFLPSIVDKTTIAGNEFEYWITLSATIELISSLLKMKFWKSFLTWIESLYNLSLKGNLFKALIF